MSGVGSGLLSPLLGSGLTAPLLGAAGGAAAPGSSLLTGLSYSYSLNELSGAAVDNLGANPMTAFNSPVGAAGKLGNARQFVAASSQRLTAPNAAALQLGGNIPWTLTAWVYFNSVAGNPGILGKYADPDVEYLLWLFSGSGNKLAFEYATGPGNAGDVYFTEDTFGALSAGSWYFISAEYDLSNIVLRVNANAGTSRALTGGIYAGASSFTMGAYNTQAGSINAVIDEVNAWKGKVLTISQLAALYNGGAGVAYPFVGIP